MGTSKPGNKNISIHAPARGATIGIIQSIQMRLHFNPRSREGSDLDISIHLNAGGDFNPRSREGSDIASHASSSPS